MWLLFLLSTVHPHSSVRTIDMKEGEKKRERDSFSFWKKRRINGQSFNALLPSSSSRYKRMAYFLIHSFNILINETEDLKEDRTIAVNIYSWLLTFLISNVCVNYWQVHPIILIDVFVIKKWKNISFTLHKTKSQFQLDVWKHFK